MIQNKSKYILDNPKEKVRQAEFKIGELERQLTRMKNTVAYLMVGVQALGKKLDYSPEQAKACIDQFIIDREMEEHEKTKNEFKAKIAAGEAPNFKVIDNMDGKADIPNGTE
jgi:hypothetical protein